MRLGDRGANVTGLRRLLWRHGLVEDWPDTYGETTFDVAVDAAVREFQKSKKLDTDGDVGPLTLAKLRAFTLGPVPPADADGRKALALLATDYLDLGVGEEGVQNRGKAVDDLIRKGGGPVPKGKTTEGPPWCAWFVSALVATLKDAGHEAKVPSNAGLAVNWFRHIPGSIRMPDDQSDPGRIEPGLVFVRTRQSRPLRDREQAKRGLPVQGHTGIVVERLPDGFIAVAGNSSGEGHDTGGTGRVALERYAVGSRGWERLVGFGRPMGEVPSEIA